MARVLITGGAGLIGSHTAHWLMRQGHEVIAYDFFHQYIHPVPATYMENLDWRFTKLLKGARIVRGSTHNKDALRREIVTSKPEYIIHFAALPLANVALSQTEEAFESIVQGTTNLLEIVRDGVSLQKFVYVSSSMVYGDFAVVPMPEDGPKSPKEIYGGMKLCGEIIVQVFAQRFDLPCAIVRPSAVYGPTDNNRRVLQILVEQAMKGQAFKAKNPQGTFLDFSYVEDVAEGVAKVTLSPRALNQAFNVTRGEGRSLAEAIDIVRQHFPDMRVEVEEKAEAYLPKRGSLDISKARDLVDYQPKYSLEAGIAAYVAFMKEHNASLRRPSV